MLAASLQQEFIQKIPQKKEEVKLEVGVGFSEKWNAWDAGREVAETAIKKLMQPPDFFLLFSTIHYEKHGGFQEFLNGVWDVLPKGTPLVGGTVAGFINPYGCCAQGATSLAASYPEMDVSVGIGHNTKRDPIAAARTCAKMIKTDLKSSHYSHSFIYEITSGGTIPQFPGLGRKRVVSSGLISRLAPYLTGISLTMLQRGVGREEETLAELVRQFPDYHIIGGSSMDDNNMVENYQFFNTNISKNSIVALGIKTDLKIQVNTTYGLKETDVKLQITKKDRSERIIKEIDNTSALNGFLKKIGWPEDFIDERLYRKTMFIPLGFKKDDMLFPNVIGLFLGKNILVGFKLEKDDLILCSASGKSLLDSVDENLAQFQNQNNHFGLIVSCAARLETLGRNIYVTQEKLLKFFGDKPFLLIYAGGEDTYIPGVGQRHINESFNVATLSS